MARLPVLSQDFSLPHKDTELTGQAATDCSQVQVLPGPQAKEPRNEELPLGSATKLADGPRFKRGVVGCPLQHTLSLPLPQQGPWACKALPHLPTSAATGPSPTDISAMSTAVPSQAAGCQDGPGGLPLICLSLAGANGNEGIN